MMSNRVLSGIRVAMLISTRSGGPRKSWHMRRPKIISFGHGKATWVIIDGRIKVEELFKRVAILR